MQPIGSMSEKIAMFMHGAALDSDIEPQCCKRLLEAGRAVNDDKFRRFQAALDEIVEKRPPGGFAFAAHVLDRQENLLAVLSHAEGDKQGNRGRFLVEPYAHDRAIEDEVDDRLCGERSGVQASQSPLTLRQTRLTVSLPTAPPNKAVSARRTRRVLVPER
jgi:hypothetical protein